MGRGHGPHPRGRLMGVISMFLKGQVEEWVSWQGPEALGHRSNPHGKPLNWKKIKSNEIFSKINKRGGWKIFMKSINLEFSCIESVIQRTICCHIVV